MQARSKKTLLSTTAIMAAALLMASQANAVTPTPDNSWDYDVVLDGNVGKDTSVAGVTNITVSGGNGFVEGNADIYAGHVVNVTGNSGATFAYRDNRANIESSLNGDLNSNMNVVIIDKDGLFFGSDFNADVQGIIASSGDISVPDIMNGGNLAIGAIEQGGDITIDGSITVAEAGLAAFVAPNVTNNGVINAKLGRVQMGAAKVATVDLYGDGLLELAIGGKLGDALLENNGNIIAEGGRVQMSAMAAKNTVDNIINNTGIITVASANVVDGKIILSGGNKGSIRNSGSIEAPKGGKVKITAERFVQEATLAAIKTNGGDVNIKTHGNVEIKDNSYIDANGGDITIKNGGVFASDNTNSLKTNGTGKIALRQNEGGSIQNAVDAIHNTGAGLNIINVGAGTYNESVKADHENLVLKGNNAGTNGSSNARESESIIAPNSPGVHVTADNVTVDGFAITGASDAVYVLNSDNILVEGNRITTAKTGIRLQNSDNARVINNKVTSITGDNIPGDGILIRVGKNILVKGNDISNTGDEGIFAFGDVNGLVISNNVINNTGLVTNVSGNGIELLDTYGNVKVVNNRISNADFYGIWVKNRYGAGEFIINGNVIKNTRHAGIRVDKDAVSVSGNNINHTGGDGIYVLNSDKASIVRNTVRNTRGNGIYLSASNYSNIFGNNVSNTRLHAIKVNPSDFVNIGYNIVHNIGQDGIHVDNGRYADIFANHIHHIGDDGIDVNSNRGVDIYRNTIITTGTRGRDGNGIEVSGSYNADIIRNYINYTGDDGIDIEHSAKVDIKLNYVRFSGNDGIDVEHSSSADIRRNLVWASGDDGIELIHSSHVDIAKNRIFRSEENGVQIEGGHALDMKSNNIRHSGENGVYAEHVARLTLADNNINNNVENGIYIAGAYNRYVSLQGNILTDNGLLSSSAAARFESGSIDISNTDNPNVIINTTDLPAIGLQFDNISYGTGLYIVDETLGATIFDGFTPAGSFYARFENGSILDSLGNPIIIDGTNASFDGIIPSSSGNVLSALDLAFIEERLYDADDVPVNGRGQIFVGVSPDDEGDINIDNFEDFFFKQRFSRRNGNVAFLTINGLPPTGWLNAQNLNNIAPAAGESGNPEDLAKINPEAGGTMGSTMQEVTCLGDALNSLSSGAVTYSFGGSFENSIAAQASCSVTDI